MSDISDEHYDCICAEEGLRKYRIFGTKKDWESLFNSYRG